MPGIENTLYDYVTEEGMAGLGKLGLPNVGMPSLGLAAAIGALTTNIIGNMQYQMGTHGPERGPVIDLVEKYRKAVNTLYKKYRALPLEDVNNKQLILDEMSALENQYSQISNIASRTGVEFDNPDDYIGSGRNIIGQLRATREGYELEQQRYNAYEKEIADAGLTGKIDPWEGIKRGSQVITQKISQLQPQPKQESYTGFGGQEIPDWQRPGYQYSRTTPEGQTISFGGPGGGPQPPELKMALYDIEQTPEYKAIERQRVTTAEGLSSNEGRAKNALIQNQLQAMRDKLVVDYNAQNRTNIATTLTPEQVDQYLSTIQPTQQPTQQATARQAIPQATAQQGQYVDPYVTRINEIVSQLMETKGEPSEIEKQAVRGEWESQWKDIESMIRGEAVKQTGGIGMGALDSSGYLRTLAQEKARGESEVTRTLADLGKYYNQLKLQNLGTALSASQNMYGMEQQRNLSQQQLQMQANQFAQNYALQKQQLQSQTGLSQQEMVLRQKQLDESAAQFQQQLAAQMQQINLGATQWQQQFGLQSQAQQFAQKQPAIQRGWELQDWTRQADLARELAALQPQAVSPPEYSYWLQPLAQVAGSYLAGKNLKSLLG